MALIPEDEYTGKIVPASTDYPYGSARDVTSTGAGDGTPLKASWVNDLWGFLQALLTNGGVTPSGSADTALVSDYYDALSTAMAGRLIKVTNVAGTSTLTLQSTTKYIRIRAVGGGGAGGGCSANTTSGYISAGRGGSAGTYGETGLIDASSITELNITIGAAGVASTGADGGAGGATSVDSYISCPGGSGGGAGGSSAFSSISVVEDNTHSTEASGTNVFLSLPGHGGYGQVAFSATVARGGRGGDSHMGSGGRSKNSSADGDDGKGYGSGGSGAAATYAGSTSAFKGGAGARGGVFVEEYA